MRLEILQGTEDPIIYPINRPRIVIGSGEGCDIILEADGVSRRHLVLSVENDQYFIIDQGSTNGSFVNEEKLQPGKKVEFNSFFPVRLGSNTLITLLSNEEDLTPPESTNPSIPVGVNFHIPTSSGSAEETRVISLKELKKAKTDELIKKRDELRTKKRTRAEVKKKKKKDSYLPTAIGLAILLGAIYFNLVERRSRNVEAPPVGLEPVAKEVPVEAAPKASPLIAENLLPTKEQVRQVMDNGKCTIDRELYLCGLLDLTPPQGASSVGLSDYIFIDASPFYLESEKLLGPKLATPDAVRDVAAYIFLLRRVPLLDLSVVKDSRLIFVLMKMDQEGKLAIENILAFLPETYNRRKEDITVAPFRGGRSSLHNALYFTRSIYTVY